MHEKTAVDLFPRLRMQVSENDHLALKVNSDRQTPERSGYTVNFGREIADRGRSRRARTVNTVVKRKGLCPRLTYRRP